MMNIKLLPAVLLGLAALATPAAYANTVAGTPDASVHSHSGLVGETLATLPMLNEATPNKSARYYIYLYAAGWCAPCNKEMPQVVEAYAPMKRSGFVELLLLDYDYTESEAHEFIARNGVLFPATMSNNGTALPGYQSPRSVPFAVIVDADGNLVKSGHASIIRAWKQHISDYEKARGLYPTFPETQR